MFSNNIQTDTLHFLCMKKSFLIIVTNNINQTKGVLKSIKLQWDSNIIIIFGQGILNNMTYKIFTVYGLREGNGLYNLIFTETFPLSVEANYYSSRKNLNGLELRTPLTISHAKAVLTSAEESEYLKIEQKISYNLLNALKDIHNFRIQAVNNANSTNILEGFDLITGFIKDKLVDTADFVIPVYPYRKAFILKNPIGSTRSIYSRPFHPKVWYTLLFFILVMTISLKILLSISENLEVSEDDKSWSMAIFMLASTFTQQGLSVMSKLLAYRVFFFTALLTTTLLINYYTSSIVSSLLSNPVQRVKSIKDLQKNRIKLGIEDMPDIYELPQEIWKKNEFKIVYSLNEAVLAISTGGFAYYTEPSIRYRILNKALDLFELCSLIEVSGTPTAYTAFITVKESEFTEFFRISFRRMIEKGLLKRELSRLLQKKSICLTHTYLTELGINDVFVAFAIYYSGVVLSILIFLLENAHVRFKFAR